MISDFRFQSLCPRNTRNDAKDDGDLKFMISDFRIGDREKCEKKAQRSAQVQAVSIAAAEGLRRGDRGVRTDAEGEGRARPGQRACRGPEPSLHCGCAPEASRTYSTGSRASGGIGAPGGRRGRLHGLPLFVGAHVCRRTRPPQVKCRLRQAKNRESHHAWVSGGPREKGTPGGESPVRSGCQAGGYSSPS